MSSLLRPGKHSRLLKELRLISRGKDDRFLMEHYEACLEAVNGPSPPEYVLLSEKLFEKEPEVWEQRASNSSSVWVLLDKKELDRLSTVSSSSGLCGVFSVPNWRLSELLDRDFFLIAWELQDPGNVGTLIRSCAALTQGVSIFVGGCSPWSSKVARASAGALLKHPVVELSLNDGFCLLYTSPSPRDRTRSRMPSSA